MDLILASTSPYRRELLERLGIPFTSIAPDCDEAAFKHSGLSPREVAGELARQKAASVARRFPAAVVIGSDQVLDFDGEVLGKAGSEEGAVSQLLRLAGRRHRLITAVAIAAPTGWDCWDADAVMDVRPLTEEAVRRYVAADRPWDCAGSYKLEARGITLFERIETEDQTTIIGLPLLRLTTVLIRLGFTIP